VARFIFHGGATSKPVPSNPAFFREMVKGVEEPTKILLVYFARPNEEWDWLFNDDQQKFSEAVPDKKLKFELAAEKIEKFTGQIKRADVIYVRGGENEKLIEKLGAMNNLKKLLAGKVYGGSSAGANAASRYFHTNSRNCVASGLGLVPVKVFCHFVPGKKKELAALENFQEKLPVYKIPEAEFVVLNEK